MFQNNLLMAAASGGGYAITKSCTFNGSDEKMTRTWSASPTANDIWSLSIWLERDAASGKEGYFGPVIQASRNGSVKFITGDVIEIYNDNSTHAIDRKTNNTVGTDWVHLLHTFELGASPNPIKIYIDGSEATYSYSLDQGSSGYAINHASQIHDVGRTYHDAGYFAGDIAEVVFIDGSVISVGDVYDGGKAVDPSGLTFGDDGFHLNFEDSSDLGKDVSGNGNDFALHNIDSGNQSTNVPPQ